MPCQRLTRSEKDCHEPERAGTEVWIGNQPISNVPGGAYIDDLHLSIETLSTAGYGDLHPQTVYGHLIATVELFFLISLMTGLIFARFSRPNARLLFDLEKLFPCGLSRFFIDSSRRGRNPPL